MLIVLKKFTLNHEILNLMYQVKIFLLQFVSLGYLIYLSFQLILFSYHPCKEVPVFMENINLKLLLEFKSYNLDEHL